MSSANVYTPASGRRACGCGLRWPLLFFKIAYAAIISSQDGFASCPSCALRAPREAIAKAYVDVIRILQEH